MTTYPNDSHQPSNPNEMGATDAWPTALLDQALKASAPPVDLAARIFAATRHQLPSQATSKTKQTTLFGVAGVLGPIGLRRLQALAAGIVLACSTGILLVGSGILRDAYGTVTAKQQLASLSSYQGLHSDLDQEISQLAWRIDTQAAQSQSYDGSQAAQTWNALQSIVQEQTSQEK